MCAEVPGSLAAAATRAPTAAAVLLRPPADRRPNRAWALGRRARGPSAACARTARVARRPALHAVRSVRPVAPERLAAAPRLTFARPAVPAASRACAPRAAGPGRRAVRAGRPNQCSASLLCLAVTGGGNICSACGGSGQPCCPNNTCNAGLGCNNPPGANTPGTCENCGAQGQACCLGNNCQSGLACGGLTGGGMGTCSSCGALAQICCAGATPCQTGGCTSGLGDNVCAICGAAGQPCCGTNNAGTCNTGFACAGRTAASGIPGSCSTCGGTGQPCCPVIAGVDGGAGQTQCETGMSCLISTTANQCGTCGGAGQPCCGTGNNGTCSAGFACAGRNFAMGAPGMCAPCGASGQTCCAVGGMTGNTMACDTALACTVSATGDHVRRVWRSRPAVLRHQQRRYLQRGPGVRWAQRSARARPVCARPAVARASCAARSVARASMAVPLRPRAWPRCPASWLLAATPARTCGGAGQPCCGTNNAGTCNTGLACGGRNAGMAVPGMCAACGGAGQLCCPAIANPDGGAGQTQCGTTMSCLVAATGSQCGTCGGAGQPCCGVGNNGTCTAGSGLNCVGRMAMAGAGAPGTCTAPVVPDAGVRDAPAGQ